MNATETPGCNLEGDSDLYGLGIRLGIYMQTFVVLISSLSSASLYTEDSLLQASVGFLGAALLILYSSVMDSDIDPIEVIPVLVMLLAQARVCHVQWTLQNWFTRVIYAVEVVILLGYPPWFFVKHIPGMMQTECHDTRAKMLAAVGGPLFYGLFVITAAISSEGLALWSYFSSSGTATATAQALRAYFFSGIGLRLILSVLAIVLAETTLAWCRFSDINLLQGAGQIMPFFVALAQLVNVSYQAVKVKLLADASQVGHGNENLMVFSDHDEPTSDQGEFPKGLHAQMKTQSSSNSSF
ncbi:hypothetical protein ESCO_002868 [Escovopsis weberi]|uniref:Uncharacterized protein n=1 Tax=Escovopsis weberi TaxID=150374 RepID=A0A0M9VSX9_ESCWE|nr:hypothetical protein ESCO_002868 [Escovopsis weberi]